MVGMILCTVVIILALFLGCLLLAIGFVTTDYFGDKLEENFCGYTLFTAGALLIACFAVMLWLG